MTGQLPRNRNGLITSAQMSSIPLGFPTLGKEAPFDATPIHQLISGLLVCATNEVESEQLEIKGWCRDERVLAEKVAEACACIAHTTGGLALVGVADEADGGAKFSACPHPMVTTAWLQATVHNFTRPPVEVVPFDACLRSCRTSAAR
jgi:hypothetical protein